MGFIAHHALVVTSSGYAEAHEALERAHAFASSLTVDADWPGGTPLPVTPILDGCVNDHRSFCILPDGSSEGWDTSREADAARAKVVAFLEGMRYEDGSRPVTWVEVYFGGDLDSAEITVDSQSASGLGNGIDQGPASGVAP